MRKWDDPRCKLVPIPDGFRQVRFDSLQMPCLRVSADDQRKSDFLQLIEQSLPPRCGAKWYRRQIAGSACSGETKAHGKNGDAVCGVKNVSVDAHPLAQAIAAGIIKWHARCVDPSAGCLPGDQDS